MGCDWTAPIPFEAWVIDSIVLYPHQAQVQQNQKFCLVPSVEDPVLSTSSLRIRYITKPTGTRRRRRTRQARPQSTLLKLVDFFSQISAPARNSTRSTNKMAQPIPRVIDLSTLRNDGTNQGPDGYTQIPRRHADYRNYIRKKLTDAFNRNHDNNPYIADQLTKYGQHTFHSNKAK
jgi:hypothetical protein